MQSKYEELKFHSSNSDFSQLSQEEDFENSISSTSSIVSKSSSNYEDDGSEKYPIIGFSKPFEIIPILKKERIGVINHPYGNISLPYSFLSQPHLPLSEQTMLPGVFSDNFQGGFDEVQGFDPQDLHYMDVYDKYSDPIDPSFYPGHLELHQRPAFLQKRINSYRRLIKHRLRLECGIAPRHAVNKIVAKIESLVDGKESFISCLMDTLIMRYAKVYRESSKYARDTRNDRFLAYMAFYPTNGECKYSISEVRGKIQSISEEDVLSAFYFMEARLEKIQDKSLFIRGGGLTGVHINNIFSRFFDLVEVFGKPCQPDHILSIQ